MNPTHFSLTSKQDWLEKVAKDLKTENPLSKLSWEPFEGLSATAYYDKEDQSRIEKLSRFFLSLKTHPWQLLEPIKVVDAKNANELALNALNKGATGILFEINRWEPTIGTELMNDVLTEHCLIAFQGSAAEQAANWFLTTYHEHRDKLTGFVVNGKKTSLSTNGFKSIGITIENGYGGSQALASYLETLDQYQKIFGDQFINQLNVCSHLRGKFYQDIAFIRSIRWLTYLWGIDQGIELDASVLHIHVSPETGGDYKKTLLSNTSGGVAGVLAGANSIHFSLLSEKSDDFNKRIARNVGNLLRDESKMVFHYDPIAGSYAIDSLTALLSEKSWELYVSQL